MPENIKYTGAPTQTPEEARRTAAIPEYRLEFPQVRLSRAGEEAGQEIGRATGQLGATMGMLGRSIDSLGKTFEGAGTEMFNRAIGLKQLEAETKVNNAAIAWELGQNKRDEDFLSKSGENANSGALQAHLKSSEDERQKARNALGSPQEQKLFDSQTTRPFIASTHMASRHAAQETKTQAKQSIEARLGIIGNSVAGATEEADAKAALKEGATIYGNERKYIYGDSDEEVHRGYMIWATKAIAARADRMASDGDTGGALKFLQDNKQDLDEVDSEIYRRVYDRVKTKDWQEKARVIADKASGDRDETYEQKEARAFAEADRIGLGENSQFKKQLVNELKNRHAIDHAKLMADRDQSWDTLDSALHGRHPVQNGKMPKSKEELLAVPGVKEAYEKLFNVPRYMDAVQNGINANARGNYPDTQEAQIQFQNWMGAYEYDPDEMRRKREETPGWWNELEIPEKYRNAIWERDLRAVREGTKAEERYVRPKTIIDRGVQEGLIPDSLNKIDKNKLAYRLSAEIKAWREANPKKFPTLEEENNFIKRARSSETVPGWFGWGTSTIESYRARLPDLLNTKDRPHEYEDAVKAYKQLHPTASEQEIDQDILNKYVLRKLRTEQGPKPSAAKPTKTISVTPGG